MNDLQLFRLHAESVTALSARSVHLERDLQHLIERHMTNFLGVHFLASEYATGKTHRGRIDSLGLDENGCPVIVEYKRHSNENVINQGLFYLDWLLDHRSEFQWQVLEKFGKEAAQNINWRGTRLLCIAADFTRYDLHAVQQIQRNIELLRYKLFDGDLLLLELVNSNSVDEIEVEVHDAGTSKPAQGKSRDKSFDEQFASADESIRTLYGELESMLFSLGDDVQKRPTRLYVAFRRLKNFVCVVLYRERLLLTLKLNPDSLSLEPGFSRDVREIGHWGTGDLELTLRSLQDLEKARPLIERSYQEN